MSAEPETAFVAMLDTLLPGNAEYPAPSQIGLAARLQDHDRFGPATAVVHALLPPDFVHFAAVARTNALQTIELEHGDLFGACLTGVYSLYYSDPAVLAVIARTTGYTPRAPQPDGYVLPPFDSQVVNVVARRAPHYRTAEGESHDQ